ncbi:hypothetical protein C8P68_105342 [Mucilaginibacter yixingensis]|uniref:Uncharacterized protein n=1 Tax=Mucilaginibacter yixingensis TaxID=1295612 RepID=A0A2T5J8R5_9SPHI|nr:hypothetical protein C8P68_105342 [Mucilaginibacter yixingensis]
MTPDARMLSGWYRLVRPSRALRQAQDDTWRADVEMIGVNCLGLHALFDDAQEGIFPTIVEAHVAPVNPKNLLNPSS